MVSVGCLDLQLAVEKTLAGFRPKESFDRLMHVAERPTSQPITKLEYPNRSIRVLPDDNKVSER